MKTSLANCVIEVQVFPLACGALTGRISALLAIPPATAPALSRFSLFSWLWKEESNNRDGDIAPIFPANSHECL